MADKRKRGKEGGKQHIINTKQSNKERRTHTQTDEGIWLQGRHTHRGGIQSCLLDRYYGYVSLVLACKAFWRLCWPSLDALKHCLSFFCLGVSLYIGVSLYKLLQARVFFSASASHRYSSVHLYSYCLICVRRWPASTVQYHGIS